MLERVCVSVQVHDGRRILELSDCCRFLITSPQHVPGGSPPNLHTPSTGLLPPLFGCKFIFSPCGPLLPHLLDQY